MFYNVIFSLYLRLPTEPYGGPGYLLSKPFFLMLTISRKRKQPYRGKAKAQLEKCKERGRARIEIIKRGYKE
jgi:hypothetical protein